jgi:Abnormal spindle-like microcephaly-assoc'd, ASPM-SPD-2-Hydin
MLSVTDDAQGSPQTVALSGTGTVVKLSPIGVNFGDQKVGTTSSPIPITLTNEDSHAPVNISNISIKGSNVGDFAQTNDCGSSVPAGGNCTINVTFTPRATGQRSANLMVSDDGGGSPQTVPLAGTGT